MRKTRKKVLLFGVLRPKTPDPLLSTSDKSGQPCWSRWRRDSLRLSSGWLSVKTPLDSLAPGILRDEAEPNISLFKKTAQKSRNFFHLSDCVEANPSSSAEQLPLSGENSSLTREAALPRRIARVGGFVQRKVWLKNFLKRFFGYFCIFGQK
jgi:hypothetical protein